MLLDQLPAAALQIFVHQVRALVGKSYAVIGIVGIKLGSRSEIIVCIFGVTVMLQPQAIRICCRRLLAITLERSTGRCIGAIRRRTIRGDAGNN